ncbi:SubName: Full=Uncharacterized protein {ECO:0000313/EMBL:CCA67527.1} [Serendipita indica DSM 11827]|nr:SubName: Full=Uncharacterized protein {ECO:0000313/EMBL:CCA67527.1} [Serendipita indica DSM 11827]
MDDGTRAGPLLDALSVVRLSTGVLFLFTLILLFTRPSKAQPPPSPSPITAVVVAFTHPRRALINTLLLFIAFTYFLDALIVFLYFILRGFRQSYFTQWRGVELADVFGFVAFLLLAAIGTYKDKHAVDFWTRKRIKLFVITALGLDIAYLVLLVLSVRIFQRRPDSPGVPERPNVPGIYVPNFLHFLALDARILALVALIIVLFKPSTHYSTAIRTADEAHGRPTDATPSTNLLAASGGVTLAHHQQAYGTFEHASPRDKHDDVSHGDNAPLGHKAVDGYDATSAATAEGSSTTATAAPGGDTKKDDDRSSKKSDHVHVPKDPEIEDVPNPVLSDEPEALNTSYAAVAAVHAEKERAAEEQEQEANQHATTSKTGEVESPTLLTFPPTRDDSSSIRNGVTFSTEAAGSKDGEEGIAGPEEGKKRRRISSQNFKRIARKITDIPKRQGSISSLGSAARNSTDNGTPKKGKVTREDSTASGGEPSTSYTPAGESPAPSIGEEAAKKRRKRMSLSLRGRSSTDQGN